MKRLTHIVLALAAVLMIAIPADLSGRNKKLIEIDRRNNPCNHWFINAGIGGNIYLSEYDNYAPMHYRVSPSFDLGGGKWFDPLFGLKLTLSGFTLNGATGNGSHGTGIHPGNNPDVQLQQFYYLNPHVDVMLNLCSLFSGFYTTTRIWHCNAYVGIGIIATFSKPYAIAASGHIGLFNELKLSDRWNFNFDLKAVAVPENFDRETGGRKGEGIVGLTLGLTYSFKKKK